MIASNGTRENEEHRIHRAVLVCSIALPVLAWIAATLALCYFPQIWQGEDSPPKLQELLSDQRFVVAQAALLLAAAAFLFY